MSDPGEREGTGVYREVDDSGPVRAPLRLSFDEAVVALRGSVRFEYYPDRAEVIIGRTSEAHLWLDQDSVSRRHCRLRFEDEGVTLEDLGSTCGVTLEPAPGHAVAHRVTSEALHEGDRFRLGSSVVAQVERRRPGVVLAACGGCQRLVEVGAGCPFCLARRARLSWVAPAAQPGPEPAVSWGPILVIVLVLAAAYLLFQVPG